MLLALLVTSALVNAELLAFLVIKKPFIQHCVKGFTTTILQTGIF